MCLENNQDQDPHYGIQSSKYYKDSLPAEDWYEEKWLNWTPETTNLEISEKHRHLIKKALPWVSQK